MAATPTVLTPGQFSSVASTVPGQPATQILTLTPGLVAPPAGSANFVAATIQQAIASDQAANTPNTTPLNPPNNFAFTDLTVNVSSATPGDQFKGTTPGITAQFIDLTPDNLLIQGIGANTFMKSDTGNDLLTASSGRNILSAGSGINTMLGGSGQDTFLADASKASASETILNFGATDDAALLGVSLASFTFSITDALTGLQIRATETTPAAGVAPIIGQITLPGFTEADIGTRLSLGLSSGIDGAPFLFVHHN